MEEVAPDKVYGFDYDSFVVCACPRIGIDDAKEIQEAFTDTKRA